MTIGSALTQRLAALGARRVWGAPLPGLDGVVPVADPDLAVLLADADGRVGTGVGAALVPGGVLHLSSSPGGVANPVTVSDPAALFDLLDQLGDLSLPTTTAIHLDLDLQAPAPSVRQSAAMPVYASLDPSFADLRVALVLGTGAARQDEPVSVALSQLCSNTGWGFFTTPGSKGVRPWYDAFHLGTLGLQAGEAALGGLAEFDLILASGVDPQELDLVALGALCVQEIGAGLLDYRALIHRWPTSTAAPTLPARPLADAVSAMLEPLMAAEGAPVAPARAALQLAGSRPDGGVVVADAGLAGFWIARAYPTREPNVAIVPATVQPGFAIAAAWAAIADQRPAVAVVDELDPVSMRLLDAALGAGVSIPVQVWGDGSVADPGVDVPGGVAAAALSPADHVTVSADQFAGQAGVVPVAVSADDEDRVIAALGDITAWGGFS